MSHRAPQNKRGPCHTRNQSLIAIVYRTKSITNKDPNIQHRTTTKSSPNRMRRLRKPDWASPNPFDLTGHKQEHCTSSNEFTFYCKSRQVPSVIVTNKIKTTTYYIIILKKFWIWDSAIHIACISFMLQKKLAKHEQSILVANQTPHVPYTPAKYPGRWSTLGGSKKKEFLS